MSRSLLTLAVFCAGLAAQQPDPAAFSPLYGAIVSAENYQPLSGRDRLKLYWRQSYANPMAPVRTLVTASFDQLNNEPPEWRRSASGYTRRVGDRFARFTGQDTMEAAGSALLQQEVRYIACLKCKAFGPRLWNAARQNVMTFNRQGHWRPAYARVGATVAAEFLPRLWLPPGHFDTGHLISGMAVQMGFGTLNNLVKEFAPEIRKVLRRKK